MPDTPDTIEDIEADIMWLEEAIGENEERLEELTSENYKPEENADDEYREKDIEELTEGIAEYRREIAKCQRKIERLKRAEQSVHPTRASAPEGGQSADEVIPF